MKKENVGKYTQKDIEFMKKASLLCDNSTCGYKTGCVSVKDGEVLVEGWNETLPGEFFCRDDVCIREEQRLSGGKDIHKVCSIHAEQSVIAQAAEKGIRLKNSILYVTTFPCVICARSIVKSGITKVFYMSEYMGEDYSTTLFNNSSIEVIQIPQNVCWPS